MLQTKDLRQELSKLRKKTFLKSEDMLDLFDKIIQVLERHDKEQVDQEPESVISWGNTRFPSSSGRGGHAERGCVRGRGSIPVFESV